MRICFLGNADSIHLRRWVQYFVDRQHEVHLVTHGAATLPGVTMHRLPTLFRKPPENALITRGLELVFGKKHTFRFLSLGSSFFMGLFVAPKLIRRIRPDIVHAHFLANYGFYAARAGGFPLVMTAWGSDVFLVPDRFPFTRPILKWILRSANLITADGDNTIERMIQLGGPPERIKKIYFGIDTAYFRPERRDAEFKAKRGFPAESVVVISVRALDPIYNVGLLVRAMPLVVQQDPRVRFVIVGRGSQAEEIKAEVARLGMSDRVVFAPFLSNEDFPVFPASADIYVSTSLADSGLAASTGEAMASGVPVISTETGATKDWVTHGQNGFIVANDDPAPLAQAILALAKDPAQRALWGQRNREIILERQDYRREMGKVEALCAELAAAGRR